MITLTSMKLLAPAHVGEREKEEKNRRGDED
jgi:hypothetical protein